MNSPDKNSSHKPNRGFFSVLVLLGFLSILALLIVHGVTLRLFSSDGILSPVTLKRISTAQLSLLEMGLILILLGLIGLKTRFFNFLRSRVRMINILLLFILLFWLLALLEIALRIIPLENSSTTRIAYEPSAYSIHKLAPYDQDLLFVDGSPHWKIRRGYRGKTFPFQKPEGEIRIVFLGGSFVFNADVPGDDDWPQQVERILHREGFPQVRVINAGVPAHTTLDSLGRLLSEIHRFEPDYIAICQAWNDIRYFTKLKEEESLLHLTRPLCKPTFPSSRKPPFHENFQIALRLKPLFRSRKFGPEGIIPEGLLQDSFGPWGIRQYRLGLETFVDICRNIHAEPILITQPRLVHPNLSEEDKKKVRYEYAELTHPALCQAFESCDRAMLEVAQEKNCPCFDVAYLLTGKSEFFKDHIHLNREGGEEMAAQIAQALLPLLENQANTE